MTTKLKHTAIFFSLLALAGAVRAELQPLSEDDLSETTGEGIAYVFDDFRFVTAPTSYVEMVGGAPVGATTLKRADVRYYGMSWTPGGTSGRNFDGSQCAAGDVRCPLGDGTFSLAAHDNPFLLRAFDYNRLEYDGVSRDRTVLEFLGPTNTPTWRFAIWGEAESNRGSNDCDANGTSGDTQCFMQSQMIIMGKAMTTRGGNKGAAMRYTTSSDPSDPTYSLIYTSRLMGDFRLSFNQKDNVEGMGVVPNFSDNEGMFLKGVQAHVPMGQLHYQGMIFKATSPGNPLRKYDAPVGNVTTEVSQIPDNPAVYNDFYSPPQTSGVLCTGGINDVDCGYARTNRPARYDETHGFIEWGTLAGTGNNNATSYQTGSTPAQIQSYAANQTDGLYYVGVSNFQPYATRPDTSDMDIDGEPARLGYAPAMAPTNVVNLGDGQADGMLIHNFYIKMLGAN